MNHPKPEEWAPYVFGEATPEARRHLNEHLAQCAECRSEMKSWKSSLDRLDAWKLPRVTKQAEILAPIFKWAAAAAVVLGVGFGIGRLSAARADVQSVRAAIEPELRQQLTQTLREELTKAKPATLEAAGKQTEQLLAALTRVLEGQRAQDNQALYSAMAKLAAQHNTDFLSLKQELDTVAVNTDAGLRNTEQQLVQLADYAQPASRGNSPKE